MVRSFRWRVPARYRRRRLRPLGGTRARPHRHPERAGRRRHRNISYGALRETSNRLANVLAARGVGRGDRVAILLPQAPAVAASHIAIYKLGAIALPLAMLFGVEAIAYRLRDSGARVLITNAQGLAKLAQPARRGGLALVLRSTARPRALGFDETLARASSVSPARHAAAIRR
jgi:acetyl-CoA synthetase